MNAPRQRSAWCRGCAHEAHKGHCPYRMSMSRVVQDMARGRAVPHDLKCQCDEREKEA